nr:MAG TPA: hypothetical protein [Bacteriophage sp.]
MARLFTKELTKIFIQSSITHTRTISYYVCY